MHTANTPIGAPALRYLHTLEQLLSLDAPTLHAALDEATDLIAPVLAADKMDIFLDEPDAAALVAYGVSDTPMGRHERAVGLDRLPLAGGGRHVGVYRSGVPYLTGQLDRDAGSLPGFAHTLGARSAMMVPLEVGGQRRGVVAAMAARADAYTADDLAFLQAIARWLGLLIARTEAEEARRQAEAAAALVAQERTMLTQVLDQLPVGVSLVEAPSGRPLFLNAAAQRLLGQPLAAGLDYRAYAAYSALHPDGTPYVPEEYPTVRAARTGEPVGPEEMRYRRGDGALITLRISAAPVRDAAGRLILAVSTFEDISARTQLEQQRDAAVRLATHDLKNPLTVLRGRVQVVQRRAARGAVDAVWLHEQLARVDEAIDHLLAVIAELSDISQLQAGQALALQPAPVDLAALVERVVAALSTPRVAVQVTRPEAPVWVEGDRVRLRRVLENVIGNALKYSPDGRAVDMRVQARDSRVTLVVTDQGVGIPAADLPHLFAPYYRAVTARGIPGSGLGLWGARAIVEQHGGTITVESTEGVGTTVTITLPARTYEPDAADG